MNKKVFIEIIDNAKSWLKEDTTSAIKGVCVALYSGKNEGLECEMHDDDNSIASLFSDIFRPDDNGFCFWLGMRNKENLDNRIFFLEIFQEYVIANQFYYSFEDRRY